MIPYHLYSGDQQAFVGRVHTAQGGSEAHHVEMRIFLTEEPTFETGVDGSHEGFFAEQALVAVDADLQNLALGVHFPTGITLVGHTLRATQFESRTNHRSHVLQIARDARTL